MGVKTHRVGVPYIYIDEDGPFPCVEISYHMQMDGMHAVTVRLPSGVSVQEADSASVDIARLRSILNKVENTANTLVSCEIIEITEPREYSLGEGGYAYTTVFKGYISQASLVYTGYPQNTIGLRLDCFGPAAKLFKRNINAAVETTIADFVGQVTSAQQHTDIAAALETGNNYTVQEGIESVKEAFITAASKTSLHVVELLALAVSYVSFAARLDNNKDIDTVNPDADVLSVLGGKTTVTLSGDGLTLQAYLSELFDEIVQGMLRGSVLQTLLSVVNSGKLMLHMVPRWSVDTDRDFKLEIAPCRAWSTKDSTQLNASHVLGFITKYAAAQALDTPDVVLVRFNQAFAYTYGATIGNSLFTDFGVACLDADLENKLKSQLRTGNGINAADLDKHIRVKTTEAPAWLVGTLSSGTATSASDINRDTSRDLEIEKTPKSVEDEDGRQIDISKDDSSLLFKQADDIAKTLFMDTYMDTQSVLLSLDPSLRFGLNTKEHIFLEEALGRVITVDLSDSAVSGLASLLVRGELCDIMYSARFDGNPSSSYTIRLRKVRYVDTKTDESTGAAYIYDRLATDPCPLYKDA